MLCRAWLPTGRHVSTYPFTCSDVEHGSDSVEELSGVWAHRYHENSDSDQSDTEYSTTSQSELNRPTTSQSAHETESQLEPIDTLYQLTDQVDCTGNQGLQQDIMDEFDPCKETGSSLQQVSLLIQSEQIVSPSLLTVIICPKFSLHQRRTRTCYLNHSPGL